MKLLRRSLSALTASAAVLAIASAHAVPIQVTVTNNQSQGGFAFTPVYFGFTDGSFDIFDEGAAASSGTELIAEVGVFGDSTDSVGPDTVMEERLAADPDSRGGVAAAPEGFAGAPVVEPGETATFIVDLDPSDHLYAQFISMLLPSNDTFFGNDDPLALFDALGNFTNPADIEIRAADLYDAGTELNDFTNGPAFVAGEMGGAGTATGGVITQNVSLASLNLTDDIGLASGDVVQLALAEAFFRENGLLATVSFAAVDGEIPIPAAAFLFAPIVGGFAYSRRRKARA